MKRKVLSAALAATLMLSSAAPSFAEELDFKVSPVGIQSSAKPDIRRGSSFSSLKPKTGKQKVLCILVNQENEPFRDWHDEKHYYNQFFGDKNMSVKKYIKDQSNNKFNIEPANTINTKYPGILKVNLKSSDVPTIGCLDYYKQESFVLSTLKQLKDKIDFDSIDINSDKSFKESFFMDNFDDEEELLIAVIFSGRVDNTTSREYGRIKVWPHLNQLRGYVNGYNFNNSAIFASEEAGFEDTNAAVLSHEFLHNLHARDMYLDDYSIGKWSIMSYITGANLDPMPLDPLHKIYMGWLTTKRLDTFNKTLKVKFNKNEIPYIVDPRDNDSVYLLEYKDFSNPVQKSLYCRGIRKDGLVVWKINRSELERDWLHDKGYGLDWYLNSRGKRTSVWVMSRGKGTYVGDTYTTVGSSRSIDGTLFKVDVRNKELVIHNRGV